MDPKQMSKAAVAAGKPTTTTAVATKKVMPPSEVVGNMLAKYSDAIKQALPSVMTPERFTRLAVNAVAANPKMMQAVSESPATLVGAILTCAQLGLEPNTPLGLAYLLPFNNYNKNKGKKEMQVSLQLGYQGVLALARRSGEISTIQARVVYANDEFDYEYGLKPYLRHKPFKGANRGEAVAYYATFTTKDGGDGFEVMWKDDVLDHARRFSKSYYNGEFSGPWATDFDAMAKKTVLLAALKYAPKATDFARDMSTDNLVKEYREGKDMRDVQAEEVIDVDAVSGPINEEPAPKSDAERAADIARDLGMKKGSDLKEPEKKADAKSGDYDLPY